MRKFKEFLIDVRCAKILIEADGEHVLLVVDDDATAIVPDDARRIAKALLDAADFVDQSRPENEYRCTRSDPYRDRGCSGYGDLSARQGYYVRATDAHHALREMRAMFPHDIGEFTVTLWKKGVR